MAATALVQTRIDPVLKERAAAVLDNLGLTVSDAVRILRTRIANEAALPFPLATDPAAHDAGFRAKLQQALEDTRPRFRTMTWRHILPSDAQRHFARRPGMTREARMVRMGTSGPRCDLQHPDHPAHRHAQRFRQS
jgi:DNA-damage-inducible protein J